MIIIGTTARKLHVNKILILKSPEELVGHVEIETITNLTTMQQNNMLISWRRQRREIQKIRDRDDRTLLSAKLRN